MVIAIFIFIVNTTIGVMIDFMVITIITTIIVVYICICGNIIIISVSSLLLWWWLFLQWLYYSHTTQKTRVWYLISPVSPFFSIFERSFATLNKICLPHAVVLGAGRGSCPVRTGPLLLPGLPWDIRPVSQKEGGFFGSTRFFWEQFLTLGWIAYVVLDEYPKKKMCILVPITKIVSTAIWAICMKYEICVIYVPVSINKSPLANYI